VDHVIFNFLVTFDIGSVGSLSADAADSDSGYHCRHGELLQWLDDCGITASIRVKENANGPTDSMAWISSRTTQIATIHPSTAAALKVRIAEPSGQLPSTTMADYSFC